MSTSPKEAESAATGNPAQAFYDRISRVYDTMSDSSEHVARERGLALLAAKPGESCFEVGFGTGHSLVALAKAVGPSGRVVGLDISPGMAKVASERLAESGLTERVELKVGAVPPLPFEKASFDAASMSFTLELFPEDQIASLLKEIRRVLRPGGRIGVVGMDIDEHPGMMERTYQWFHRHFPHIVDCRPIDIAGVLRDAGFDIVTKENLEMWGLKVGIVLATSPE